MEKTSKGEFLLKRSLKRSKLFQIQKLTKSIRLLENKRGNESQLEKNRRKVERLARELEIIKDINVSDFSKLLYNNDTIINEILHCNEVPVDIETRAKWRILHCKKMGGVFEPADMKTKDSKRNKKSRTVNKESALMNDEEQSDCCNKSSNKRSRTYTNNNNKKETKDIPCSASSVESVFIGSLSSKQSKNSEKETCSQSLAKRSKSQTKKKMVLKNRMGQRQRRKIWETVYGNHAKHLKNRLTKKEITRPLAQQDTSSKVNEVLHPSWEASRKRKAQELLDQSTVKCKHVVFNDSD